MRTGSKRALIAIGIVGAISIGIWGVQSTRHKEEPATWRGEQEGFLAVAAADGARVGLWSDLGTTKANGQGARPATAAEAVTWIDTWPYQSPKDDESADERELHVAARSREVRCTGAPTGESVPQRGDEEETLEALRGRLECTYAKWMIWSGETAKERLNERHTVWADELGRFHGRVDYWR